MATDREFLGVVKELRDLVGTLIEKQEVYDKRLKDIDDNFHNQSPNEFDAPNGVSYASSGKNTDRDDMKGENTKGAKVSTVAKSASRSKPKVKMPLRKNGEYRDDNDEEDDEPAEKGYGMMKDDIPEDEAYGHMGMRDVPPEQGEEDMEPFVSDPRDDEIHEIKEMLKQALGLSKSLAERNDFLMAKLEEISKQKAEDDVPLLSKMVIKKSIDSDVVAPVGMWTTNQDLGDVAKKNAILSDFDNVISSLVKGAVNKRGDISEAALSRINRIRYETGELAAPSGPTYNSGIPGM